MKQTEKIVISSTTLITSLLCYSYARDSGKDAAPLIMIGAFTGTLIGEALAEELSENKDTRNSSILKQKIKII